MNDELVYKCMSINIDFFILYFLLSLFKDIPMTKLNAGIFYEIHLLYYINLSHFYVYLREKTRSHNQVNRKYFS